MIEFDEVLPFTENPVYMIGGRTVSFGSLFEGQTLGTIPNSLSDSSPSNPLMLSSTAPAVATAIDMSNPSFWVLGGTDFKTPLAMLFDAPVNRVEFDLGSLDGPGSVKIEVYDQQGNTIGSFGNSEQGIERIALADHLAGNVIAGVSVFVLDVPGGMDWEGFALDNVSFAHGPIPAPIPEPGAMVIWLVLAVVAMPFVCKKKKMIVNRVGRWHSHLTSLIQS